MSRTPVVRLPTKQLGREVPLLGELGVVERLTGRFEIGAGVLPVGIEEQRVEPAVEIVVVGDVALARRAPVELLEPPPDIPHHRSGASPGRCAACSRATRSSRSAIEPCLHHEGAVHVGFAELELGIEQHGILCRSRREARGDNRTAAVSERENRPPRAGHLQIAAPDMPQCCPQQPVHGRPRRPSGSRQAENTSPGGAAIHARSICAIMM